MAYKAGVLIVGHSFVRHLKQLCATSPEWDNLGMKRERHAVGFHGRTAAGKNMYYCFQQHGATKEACEGGSVNTGGSADSFRECGTVGQTTAGERSNENSNDGIEPQARLAGSGNGSAGNASALYERCQNSNVLNKEGIQTFQS